MQKSMWWLLPFALLFIGCVTVKPIGPLQSDPTAPLTPKPIPTTIYGADVVPPVDLTKASVPLEEIYFDTFRSTNRTVSLVDADAELINRLRDAIPPLNNPQYVEGEDAKWLSQADFVLGYATETEAWAYPLKILNYHEIVNDELGGEPVLVSYCPLCYSGVVFSRMHNGQELRFGNTSALYESDMVMLDYETGSYWWQLAGKAIVGELNGETLTALPSQTISWGAWREQYPHSKVLSIETGYRRDYQRDSFNNYDEFLNAGGFAFPVSDAAKDARLEPGTRVLGIKINEDDIFAYPLVGEQLVTYNISLAGTEAAVFIDPSEPTGTAFSPLSGTQFLTFNVVDGVIVDDQTQSEWNFAGRATSGSLDGTQLQPLQTITTYWFALIASEPTTQIATP